MKNTDSPVILCAGEFVYKKIREMFPKLQILFVQIVTKNNESVIIYFRGLLLMLYTGVAFFEG